MEFLYFLLKENEFAQSCLILCNLSDVQLFATPWTVACKAPLSMEFPRQKYRSGLPFPSPGDFPKPGIEPIFLDSRELVNRFLNTEPPGQPNSCSLLQASGICVSSFLLLNGLLEPLLFVLILILQCLA